MKIIFIFAFILVCGLAFCEEENIEFQDEISDLEDPKGKPPCYRKCVRVYGCKKVYKFVRKCKLVRKCSFKNVRVRVCSKKCYYKLGKRYCKPVCRYVYRRKFVCKPERQCKRVKVPGKKCGYKVKCTKVCPKKY